MHTHAYVVALILNKEIPRFTTNQFLVLIFLNFLVKFKFKISIGFRNSNFKNYLAMYLLGIAYTNRVKKKLSLSLAGIQS